MSDKQKNNEQSRELTHEEIGELVNLEAELQELKHQDMPEGKVSRFISGIFDRSAVKTPVKKKTYIWLAILTGIVGGHRFYSKKWFTAFLYLATCWIGFSVPMTIVDLLIVLPMKADENGMIEI